MDLYCFLCTQKVSTLLKSVSVSVRPSVYPITSERRVRSWWNFLHSSVSSMPRSSSKIRGIREWVIKKIVIFDQIIPEGEYGDFFRKYFAHNYSKHIQIDSVFHADSESDICFEPNHSFCLLQRWLLYRIVSVSVRPFTLKFILA